MGRGERVAEARDRVAHPAALGIQLAQALLELGGHVVEGRAEGGELVAPAHRNALVEPALGDPSGGSRELAEGADDRAAERVREDPDGDHRHGGEEQEPAAEVVHGVVDHRLRAEGDEGDRRPLRSVLGSDQVGADRAIGLAVDRDEARALARDLDRAVNRARGNRPAVDDERKEVTVVEGGPQAQTLDECIVDGHVDDHPSHELSVDRHRDESKRRERRRPLAGEQVVTRRVERAVVDVLRQADERRAIVRREGLLDLRRPRERAGGLGRVVGDLLLEVGLRHPDRGGESRVGRSGLASLRDLAEGDRRRHERKQRQQHEVDDEAKLETSHGCAVWADGSRNVKPICPSA